jgi:hypothetical protein
MVSMPSDDDGKIRVAAFRKEWLFRGGVVLMMCLCMLCWYYFSEDLDFTHQHSEAIPDIVESLISIDISSLPIPERPPVIESPQPISSSNPACSSLYDVLSNWNPDVVEIPSSFREKIQHFDFNNPAEFEISKRYRAARVPFKLFNVPEVLHVSTLWTDEYLIEQIGNDGMIEVSPNNHFLFANRRKKGVDKNFKYGTRFLEKSEMDFTQFLKIAHAADSGKLSNSSQHFYFMANGMAPGSRSSKGRGGKGRGGNGRGGGRGRQQQQQKPKRDNAADDPADGGRGGGGGGGRLQGSGGGGRGRRGGSSREQQHLRDRRRLEATASTATTLSASTGKEASFPAVTQPQHNESSLLSQEGISRRKLAGASFINKDLPMFSTLQPNWIKGEPSDINCRFGMRGVIAESHFDAGENFVGMFKGKKRYIINPPGECKKLGVILDNKHPSTRHSVIDWSDLAQARMSKFDEVVAIDTVVKTGEILYIPSYWFHYIISLEYSIQCNTRNGSPPTESTAHMIEKVCTGNGEVKYPDVYVFPDESN